MPTLRKRIWPSNRVTWDIRYYQDGTRKTHTIGEANRKTAEKVYHQFCLGIKDDRPRLSDLADWAYAMKKSESTREREQHSFRKLIEVLGNIPLSKLSVSRIEEYKQLRLASVKPSTVNLDIRVLNTALRQAGDNAPGPFRMIPIKERSIPEWLNEDEVLNLLNINDIEFKQFLQLLLYTGMRRNEVLELTWDDIDLNRRMITVRAETSKMNRSRQIPINTELQTLLEDWNRDNTGKLFPDYRPIQVSMKFRRWADKIGLSDNIKLHSLRSTFACHLIRNGVDIYTISKLLGHSSIKITEKYYLALDQDKAREAVMKLSFNDRTEEQVAA